MPSPRNLDETRHSSLSLDRSSTLGVSFDTQNPLASDPVKNAHQILIRSLKEHSVLAEEDLSGICSLTHTVREFQPNEDFIRQGDHPELSALVVSGMVARYHLLDDGSRQYLSFHIAGDLPDAQGLFIDEMDHALCAIGRAEVAFFPHREMLRLFKRRPAIGFSIWRETLVDAAIFREAITNNSARTKPGRMAHFFCELFYRARVAGLNDGAKCILPISLTQLGETLGMAIASVNRSLQELRASGTMDFRDGELVVTKWRELKQLAGFNPQYLHMKKQSLI